MMFASIHDPASRDAVKPSNDGNQKCKICEKRLSMYNSSIYCFIHVDDGMLIEDELEEKRERDNMARYKRKRVFATKEYNNRYNERLREKRKQEQKI